MLDVGGGLGGPARTLAARYGCRVTVIDLTESYVRAGGLLTERLRLGERVSHQVGNALELPYPAGAFDMVWTQNSGMNIADKERLYAGFHRVLRPGGLLAFQEPMAGPTGPPIFPLMWARDASQSFLRSPDEMRALIEAAGFRIRVWDDVTAEASVATPVAALPPYAIAKLVMGDELEAIDAGRPAEPRRAPHADDPGRVRPALTDAARLARRPAFPAPGVTDNTGPPGN